MKTTMSLDEDVLKVMKRLARSQGLTLGEVASSLLRHALTAPQRSPKARRVHPPFPTPAAQA